MTSRGIARLRIARLHLNVVVVNGTGSADPRPLVATLLRHSVRADGALIGPAKLIDGVTTVPAKPGETIQLFGTGFGPTTPGVTAGTVVWPYPLDPQHCAELSARRMPYPAARARMHKMALRQQLWAYC